MLRALRGLAFYLSLTGLLSLTVIGLLNTVLGKDSPTRAVTSYLASSLRYFAQKSTTLMPVLKLVDAPEHLSLHDPIARKSETPPPVAVRAGHAVDDAFDLCAAPRSQLVPIAPDRTAYTWVNEDGVVSFGDEMPDNADARPVHLTPSQRDFKLNLIADGVIAPQTLHGQLSAGAKRIYDQWYEWLGSERIHKAEVNVHLVGDHALFRRLWGRSDSDSYPAGFYRMANNTVYIDYNPGAMTDERLFALAFHELSHLIASWQVGVLPPWFSEGLAEYFETMSVAGQGADFRSVESWRYGMAGKQLLPLEKLFALNRQEWWQGDVAAAYQSAGTLFAFLYSSDAGRTTRVPGMGTRWGSVIAGCRSSTCPTVRISRCSTAS